MNNIRLIDYFAAHAMCVVINEKYRSHYSLREVARESYRLAFEMMMESKSRDNEGRELSYHEANR